MKNAEAQFFLFKNQKRMLPFQKFSITFPNMGYSYKIQYSSIFNVGLRLHKHYIKSNMHFKTLKASYIATCLCLSQHSKLVQMINSKLLFICLSLLFYKLFHSIVTQKNPEGKKQKTEYNKHFKCQSWFKFLQLL